MSQDTSLPKAHRPVASGLSVLARGESFVWLSGGMLIVAIGMIVVLLSFVFYRGMATFWPAPLAVYPMREGVLLAGEPQATESFTYQASQLESLSANARSAAMTRLDQKSSADAKRTYLRVENFDISGKHFDYLNEFERISDKPFYPPNAWVVERREAGRFYGVPTQLAERFSPVSDAKILELKAAEDLLAVLQGYVTGESDAIQAVIDDAQSKLQNAEQKVALNYFQRVVQGTTLQDGEHWQVELADSSVDYQSAQSLPENSIALNLMAVTPTSIWNAYQLAAASIAGLRRNLDLMQEELANIDDRLRASRLTLRQAELDYDISLIDRVTEFETDWSAISIATSQLADQSAAFSNLKTSIDVSTEQQKVLSQAFEAMRTDIQSQINQLDSDVDQRLANLTNMPPACLDIIKAHRNVFAATTVEQIKLNAKMVNVELEVESAKIVFSATNLATPIALESFAATDNLSDKNTVAIANALTWQTATIDATLIGDNAWWLTSQTDTGFKVAYLYKTNTTWQVTPLIATELDVANLVRAYRPNQLSLAGKLNVFGSRWSEFVSANPRDGGMEGGFFPAIWGTIVMTMIMAIMVVPFGVLAALYMREYASNGWIVGILRIAINNLAGVPSVVYGVFGLAFFCYICGGFIDGGPSNVGIVTWSQTTWFMWLAILAAVSLSAFFLGFVCSGSPMTLSPRKKFGRNLAGVIWAISIIGFIVLISKLPFFYGFYAANLPNPTFGKGGLIWASLTLALLTLPVVIVATEEALSAVPNSLREGSYACGAGKWQTIQRIVLPHARPGIMTGTILAMARGAGEVAPMMLVGALPMAIDLPLDTQFPFFHGSRSFMHLGFQIYALGFQGQNSEAAKPMVFTTTLLLILIVLLLNLVAIILRARMRKRFQGVQF